MIGTAVTRYPAAGYWAGDVAGERIVRRFVERFNTGELAWDQLDPGIVWVIDPPAFLAGTYHGHEGVRTLVGRFTEIFDEASYELDELIDAGDSVVALGRFRVRGAHSAMDPENRDHLVADRDELFVLGRHGLPRLEEFEVALTQLVQTLRLQADRPAGCDPCEDAVGLEERLMLHAAFRPGRIVANQGDIDPVRQRYQLAYHLHVLLVLTLRDGKLTAYRAYFDREQALEAAGLRE